MKLNKNILTIIKKISANPNIRPALSGITLCNNSIYATDSFKVIKFPCVLDDTIILPPLGISIFGITRDFFAGIDDLTILKYDDDKNILEVLGADGNIFNLKTEKNKVDFEAFLNLNDDFKEIGLNINLLLELLDTYKKHGIDNIKLSIGERLNPIKIEGAFKLKNGEYGDNYKSILMPVRLD